jgi:hypothetical protein
MQSRVCFNRGVGGILAKTGVGTILAFSTQGVTNSLLACEIGSHFTVRSLFRRNMGTSGFTYNRECVLRIHGTYASLAPDDGPAWWQARPQEDHRPARWRTKRQEEHHFWKHVLLKLPTPIEADKKVFHWNGGNSECDRQVAAAALLDQLLELEEIGTAYHLVGHSRGGSVLWAALCLACERGNNLNGLLSWTTVGTPFLCFRRAKVPGLGIPLIAASATVAIALAIAPLWDDFLMLLSQLEVKIVVMAILAATAWLVAIPYFRFRRGAYEREAASRYGDKWLAINSAEDEAIGFLSSVEPLTSKLTPRWQDGPPPPRHPNTSQVEGFAESRGPERRLMGQRALMFLPLITFAIVLAGFGLPYVPGLPYLFLQVGVSLFWIIGTLFTLSTRWTYNRWGAGFVQRRLLNVAYGNDTRDFRVTHVSSCPPISGRRGACPNLPSTIDVELVRRANSEAMSLVPLVRPMLYQACAHTPTLADDQNMPGLSFSGRELVHTSYFDSEDVLRIIHAHIVMQSRAPGMSLKDLDPWIVEWIHEFKIAVAPHFAQRGLNTA